MKPATNVGTKPKKKIHFILFMAAVAVGFSLLFWLSLTLSNSIAGPAKDGDSTKSHAFNTKLPDANLSTKEKSKLEVYLDAERDSLKRKQQSDNDSYKVPVYDPAPPPGSPFVDGGPVELPASQQKNAGDANEKKVKEKLDALKALLANPSAQPATGAPYQASRDAAALPVPMHDAASANAATIAQLENMLAQSRQKDNEPDPEMVQLREVLTKLAEVQDPESTKAKRAADRRQKELPLRVGVQPPASEADTLLSLPVAVPALNTFYGVMASADTLSAAGDAIPCVIHETQTLYNGSTVRLRTLQDIWVGTTRIPKGTFVFGRCSIAEERLLIALSRITYNNQLYAVELGVFDATDGQEGLSVPGAVTDNTVRDGVDRMTQALAVGSSLDGTVGAQATNAGIQAASGLLSKKIKNVRVTARSGHVLLLKNTRTN